MLQVQDQLLVMLTCSPMHYHCATAAPLYDYRGWVSSATISNYAIDIRSVLN